MIVIRALAETGHRDEALEKARSFVHASPDAESLFLLARAANAAGDHAEEISALRRLVATAKRRSSLREQASSIWDKPWHETDNAGRPYEYWKKQRMLRNSQANRNN